MREVLEETQSSHETRGHRLSNQARQPASDNLYADQMAEKASSRESGAWETLREDLAGPAFVHSWPEISKIEALQADYPNFSEVCEFVIRKIGLSRHTPTTAVSLPNLLLEGGPSSGKSSFTERLTGILVGEDYARVDLGQSATNFALVGSDSEFSRGKEGRILRLMAGDPKRRPVANPVVILDEVDKALDDSKFNPLPALLSLLEKRDAKRFTDEFFTVPVDASRVNFIGLANTLRPLSQPLLSRFTIFQIADYTEDQMLSVVIPAIYRNWLGRFYPGTFPTSLSLATRQEIADAAASIPRRVGAILDQFVSLGHPELTPAPVWEGLAQYPVSPRGAVNGAARE